MTRSLYALHLRGDDCFHPRERHSLQAELWIQRFEAYEMVFVDLAEVYF
jgi:hypothetical protein